MELIVETYRPHGDASSASIRVKPLPGQGIDTALRVECSRSMRAHYPVGALLKLEVRLTDREGTPFLYAHPKAPFAKVSVDEARRFIEMMYGKNNATRK